MRLPVKAALVAAALGAAVGGYLWLTAGNGAGAPQYRLAKVERGPLSAAVVASGTLNAVSTVQVGSQISGQIKEIHVDFNSPVREGQVIARIDPATFELRVSQARADLDKARTMLEVTREQAKAVAAQGRIGQAQVRSALAAVKQRESLLRQAEVDLERTIIRAPVDGTVILRNVDAGQTVAASLQAPVLFTIARDLRDMQVEAAINEADVGRLRPGQPATFTVDAFPRRSFSGELVQIRKSPVAAQNVVSYTVVISARNPDLALLPGMTANVRIVVDERENALKVPNAALRFRPPGASEPGRASARVWVPAPAGPRPVELRLGLSDGTSTEIVDGGLEEGAEVIVGLAAGAAKRDSGLPRAASPS